LAIPSTVIAQQLQIGYCVVNPTGGSPAGTAVFNFPQRGILISEAGVPSTRATRSARAYVEASGSVNTGLAIANPNDQPASIIRELHRSDGAIELTDGIVITSRGQKTAFLTELFPGVAADFRGTLTFNSDVPIAAIAVVSAEGIRGEM
jgi:hypothetical protein